MRFVDLPGLTYQHWAITEYAHCGDARYIATPDRRLTLLKQLSESAGVTVLTGPMGRRYWELASREVTVLVWPDDYVHSERSEGLVWALQSVGVEAAVARRITAKPPTRRHGEYARYERAVELLREYDELPVQRPIVVDEHGVTTITPARAVELLGKDALYALDWEWHEDTGEPIGLSIADGQNAYYVPVWQDRDLGAVRAAFVRRYGAGQAVLHGGRADLALFPEDAHS